MNFLQIFVKDFKYQLFTEFVQLGPIPFMLTDGWTDSHDESTSNILFLVICDVPNNSALYRFIAF